MRILCLQDAPSPDLALALERFEQAFVYPLGPGRSFRISHGTDYSRFFRAMGEARCFVALREDRVLGVASVAIRQLHTPEGSEISVAYIGDVKTAPYARGGRGLIRLADAMKEWLGDRVTAAFGVVMDGTPVTPERYTGRLGIPAFEAIGRITVLRIRSLTEEPQPNWIVEPPSARECLKRLAADVYWPLDGEPSERSMITPQWLVHPDGQSCGRLEDTRQAKRLIADDGSEKISAHLSYFKYESLSAGIDLLTAARRLASHQGFPAIFVAVPSSDAETIRSVLGPSTVAAPATMFGTGLPADRSWLVSTAEI